MATNPVTDELIESLRLSWANGKPLTASELIRRHPDVVNDSSAGIDIIYAEVLLREQHGETPIEQEYVSQFPEWHDSISRQFQLHRALIATPRSNANSETLDGTHHPTPTMLRQQPRNQLPEIPGFEILEVAGEGGIGVAYRAFDIQLKRDVAIKVLRMAGDQSNAQLIREAEAAAKLQHEGIVQVHQIGAHRGVPYLVMEYIDGQSLAEKLRAGPMPVADAISLTIQIAQAIEYAHNQGVIHRDLKPGNVLLDHRQGDKARVCDFGMARQFESDETLRTSSDIVGTPAYMPPEQARGETATVAADVYSLGATLYHALTGRPPFQAASSWEILNQVMVDDPVSPQRLNRAISKDLDTVLAKSLHKNPLRRFENVAAFSDELQRIADGKPIHSRPAGLVERTWKLCRRNPVPSTFASVTIVALIVVAVVSILSAKRVEEALGQTQQALADAETQRDVAFESMEALVLQVNRDLSRYDASVEAREGVLRSAIAGLQKIVKTSGQRDETLVTMVGARLEYGYILNQQARNDEATEQYELAIALAASVPSEAARHELVSAHSMKTRHHIRLAEVGEALETGKRAVELAQQLIIDFPQSSQANKLIFTAMANYALALSANNQPAESLKQRFAAEKKAVEYCQAVPEDKGAAQLLIDIKMGLASALFLSQRNAEAESIVEDTLKLIDKSPSRIDEDAQLFRKYLDVQDQRAMCRFRNMDYRKAIDIGEEVAKERTRLQQLEPNRPANLMKLAVAADHLSAYQLATGKLDEAETNCLIAIQHLQNLVDATGSSYEAQRHQIAVTQLRLADIQARRGRYQDSAATMQNASEVLEPISNKFNLQEMVSAIAYQGQLVRSLASLPSSAAAEDVQLTKRAMAIRKSLESGDLEPFVKHRSALKGDLESAKGPMVATALAANLANCHGLAFKLLMESGADQEAVASMKRESIEAILMGIQTYGVDPALPVISPDFVRLREVADFRTAFQTEESP